MQNVTLSFTEISQSLGPLIDAALDARTQLGDGCPARLREAMRYSLLAPGKRIRPLLVLLAARACGGEIESAMPAACAVEMIHAYSLIHDDLPAMDDDDLRRGQPTCHKAFDEATAILAGDALLPLAFETLAREIEPPATAVACCVALAQAAGACNMAGGQADDVEAGKRNDECGIMNDELTNIQHSSFNIHHSLLESIHHRKTGAMIRVSLRLGAMVAGADEVELAALDEYGRRLGLVFQITDDLLDVQSTEVEMGKRTGKDARRGKLTFPGILGLDRSTQYARQLVVEACRAVAGFGPQADGLRALAQYVLERNR
ncbi:MAG: polyprenyl synthetase family protein [Planctomycetes bacterium]|nr:polyprenyl synthetase family protein [Planctomycetota bacterium]MBU4399069.1 polyprenyl synthetase family protein [Planctomycetota bacterium]MCG2682344.1 polyprenyl synthetase family protein [Planctomycetales bacterium]